MLHAGSRTVAFLIGVMLCAHVRADERAEIEAVLASMTTAVIAGDKTAYLKHVDMRDAEFAMEQQHWADDLDRHKPLEFVLEIVENRRENDAAGGDARQPAEEPAQPTELTSRTSNAQSVFGPDRATMTLRMRYRMETGHARGDRGKRAVWPAIFVKHDVDGAGPEPARWLYAGEEWLEVSGEYGDKENGTSGTFVVKHQPGSESVAQQVLEAFPGAKAHADEVFDINLTRPLQIKLYRNMEHLKAWVYLSMPDTYLGGWNEPGESIKFMANYTSGVDKWRGAFAHEYGHVATWEFGPKVKTLPWWMVEGVAELAAEKFTKNGEFIHRMMLRLANKDKLCTWEEISDYDKADQRVKQMAYHQGQALMTYVTARWGQAKRNQWIKDAAHGMTLSEATQKAFGVTFEELDAAWRKSLAEETPAEPEDAKAQTPSGGG